MTTILFCLHITAALLMGHAAHRRGRRFIVWTLLTLIPYGILVTWPLLYILPRYDLALASPAERDDPTNNNSFYVGVAVWLVFLVVVGVGIALK